MPQENESLHIKACVKMHGACLINQREKNYMNASFNIVLFLKGQYLLTAYIYCCVYEHTRLKEDDVRLI